MFAKFAANYFDFAELRCTVLRMPRAPQLVEIEPAHLVRLREKDRQSKTQLARAAGISLGYLADLESGRRKGNPAVIGKLADALNVPTSMLERRRCAEVGAA